MGKVGLSRGSTARGGSSIRGGRTRGNAAGRSGASTSRSTPVSRGGGTSPIRSTTVSRGGSTNRGKGKDPLYRNKDASLEKAASKKCEKNVYKVKLSNAVIKKLIAAKSKGAHMKINVSDKMEIDTGEGEKIQLNVSSPKKAQMIFIRNDDTVDLVGNVIGCANNTAESHTAAKRDLDKRDLVAKKVRESYAKVTKGKRKVQVLEYDEIPSEQEVKSKSKRQKNNVGSSIKVQPSPPPPTFVHVPSNKVTPQLSSAVRGGKHLRGKARGGRVRTVTTTEAADVDDVVETTTTTSVRGVNTTRGGKTIGSGKSTRGRVAKTIGPDVPKVNNTLTVVQSTKGKRGRPAGVTNKTTRGTKTYPTMTTRTSAAPKPTVPSTTVKNDNEQQSMSEGSSSSKKGKSKANANANGNGQPQSATSLEWKPGQTITILTEFRQARRICEDMENDIQEVIKNLGEYESHYNSFANSIKNIAKESTQDCLLKEIKEIEKIENHFGDGSRAHRLMQKYVQLEKDIKIIYDELWRAANTGVYDE